MGPEARPLVVIEGRTGLLSQAVADALAAARRDGWEIVRGWTTPARQGPFVCCAAVRTPEDAGLARDAAASGAGLIVAASAARMTIDWLVADLRRHGRVRHLREGGVRGPSGVSEKERALLGLLAEGLTLEEAGRELRLGAGAARKRFAAASRRAGSESPTAAVTAALRARD